MEISTNKDKIFWPQRKEESITEESDIRVKGFCHEWTLIKDREINTNNKKNLLVTEDAEKKREFYRVKTKLYMRSFAKGFFIPFLLPLTKSALRINAAKSLEKIDCLSVASFEFFLDFQGYLADFSQA